MSNPPTRLRGKLLLADPSLRQSTFHKSVIVIHDHHPTKGAMGMILNQPTGKVVGDLLKDPAFAPLFQVPVHEGGPVDQEQLTFASFWWDGDSLRWKVHISVEQAIEHTRQPGSLVRAFLGYSGWSAGQLESELKQSAWFPVDPEPDLLGYPHDKNLWRELLGRLSPAHRLLAEAPDDPLMN